MSEYMPARGLMWICLTRGEKPTWIGGDYHVSPHPSIAHLFSNTTFPTGEDGHVSMPALRQRARDDLAEHIEELLQRSEELLPEGLSSQVDSTALRRENLTM